jgi:hypothetical protein
VPTVTHDRRRTERLGRSLISGTTDFQSGASHVATKMAKMASIWKAVVRRANPEFSDFTKH